MISYIDTEKVETIATEVYRRAKGLDAYFDSLFRRLNNVPDVTKEWVGNQSKNYFTKIARDKKQYINLVNDLKEISRELENEAIHASILIKKLNK